MQVRVFSVQGQQLHIEFSLGEACETEGVSDCCVYGGGVVALTHANHLWAVTDVNEPRPQRLADPLVEEPPHCMEVMVNSTYGVEVGGMVCCDTETAQEEKYKKGGAKRKAKGLRKNVQILIGIPYVLLWRAGSMVVVGRALIKLGEKC